MHVTAEIRWFWAEPAAAAQCRDWFWHSRAFRGEPGGGKERIDEYLWEKGQSELGIKRRGKKAGLEVKGLVARAVNRTQLGTLSGPVDIWTKWSAKSADLGLSPSLRIAKLRWLRKWITEDDAVRELALGCDELPVDSSTPAAGCNVEFTELHLPGGEPWWTLGFEAFGELNTVVRSLELVTALLDRQDAPAFSAGLCASYPAWIATLPE